MRKDNFKDFLYGINFSNKSSNNLPPSNGYMGNKLNNKIPK